MELRHVWYRFLDAQNKELAQLFFANRRETVEVITTLWVLCCVLEFFPTN